MVGRFREGSLRIQGRYSGILRLLERKRQRKSKKQRSDRDDSFADRPGLNRLRYAHIEVLLHKPEAAVVDMGEDERTGSSGNG